jgi:TonB-linked SusC/RagA family outer membrane protein
MSGYRRRLSIGLALALALLPAALRAQATGSVTGQVVDATSRAAIEGVQVQLVGTTRGALTNEQGRYTIPNVVPGAYEVRAAFIGYSAAPQQVTVTAGQSAVVDFELRQTAITLDEVFVTGYGTSTRANVSTAIANLSSREIANTPVAGVDAALQGRAPGVQVVQNAGNPGVGITVRIRGHASISASNQPLWVVDGMPILRGNYSQIGVGGQDLTGVTGLNPDDIESITVLKDAAASAIYGSRGSNGVIMITTKRGSLTPGRLNFSMYTGTQNVEDRWELLTGPEYIEYIIEGMRNDGYDDETILDELGTTSPGSVPNIDWQDAVFKSAAVSDFNLGVSGSGERLNYYLTGGYFNQRGVVLGSGYSRASSRLNADFNASDRLLLRASIGLSREEHERIVNDNTINGVVTNAIALQPHILSRTDDGTYTSPDDGLEYTNPLAIAEFDQIRARGLRAIGSIEAEYDVSETFQLNTRVGADVLGMRDIAWSSPRVIGTYAQSAAGVSNVANTTVSRYLTEAFVTWNPRLGRSLFTLVGGSSVEFNHEEVTEIEGEGFANEQIQWPGNASTVTSYSARPTDHNLVSGFARANLTLLDRYLVTGAIRVDGSSRFGENNRYGVFPAFSLGWRLSDEPFAQGLARIADVKLRTSIGLTGNQELGSDFGSLARFTRAAYAGTPGLAQSSLGNPDLRWEQTREINAGFDIALSNGRIGVIGDWYHKETQDLLLDRPITSTSGQTSVLENIGNMENRGFELTVNTVNIPRSGEGGFSWTTDANITWNTNEVTRLFRDEPFNTGVRSVNRIEVGQPLGAYYAARFDGVDPETGDALYADLDADGNVIGTTRTPGADDRLIVGSPHPDYWGGITNALTWRNFDLRAFVQFAQGHEVYNAIAIFADDGGYYYDNKFKRVLRRWRQPGDVTDQPRASWDGASGARNVSSRYIEDGSYVRLQEVTFGYRIPASLSRLAAMNDARIYISGRNLKTWTDYSGYSPDVNSNGSDAVTSLGTDFYAYPIPRTLLIGITGSF